MSKHYDHAETVADLGPKTTTIKLRIEGLRTTYEDGVFELDGLIPIDWDHKSIEEFLEKMGVTDEEERMYLGEGFYRRVSQHTLGMQLAKRTQRVG